MSHTFKIGDKVEVAHDADWRNAHEMSDRAKAIKLGKPGGFFIGNAAAYMHLDEAYVVEGITKKGGLQIRGFDIAVSPKDVRISTKPVRR